MPVTVAPTEIPEVLLVKCGVIKDHRGSFSESHSVPMFEAAGLHETFLQDNVSVSKKGTLRGLHYQLRARGMGKLVRVLHGSVFDVAVDLRRRSPTFGKWVGRTLVPGGDAMFIPVGFAHGFLALEEASLVYYKCTEVHAPDAERSVHYADPAIGIAWPFAPDPELVSGKDAAAPPLAQAEFDFDYAE
jgi:dTDP-4-dehydrorhamnose 3,5-epimerase